MQRILVLILLALVLVACNRGGGQEVVIPTLAPAADINGNDPVDGSPRVTATPESGLPPTWTPVPTVDAGNIFTDGGTGGDSGQSPTFPNVPAGGTRIIHIIQPGDTLSKLAIRYSVPVTDIARINNVVNWDVIEVGEELIIPLPGD